MSSFEGVDKVLEELNLQAMIKKFKICVLVVFSPP